VVLPLGDQPNPRGIPVVTYALIAANVAIFVFVTMPLKVTAPDPSDPALLEYLQVVSEHVPRRLPAAALLEQISAYDLFVFHYGFRPAAPHVVALFTSLFLHGGLMHLIGNMLFLWIYGDNVEHRLGRVAFLVLYVLTGVSATLFHTTFDADSPLPLVGASGAISGVLGFYFLWFPHNQVRLLFLLFPFFLNVVAVPARIVLGFYLIADNLLPFLVMRGIQGGGVAHGAHIGGFLAGLGVAWFMDRRELTARPVEYRGAAAPAAAAPGEVIARALVAGNYGEAARTYFSLAPEQTRRILTPDETLDLGDWLATHGHARAALTVYRRHLRDYPNGPGAAAAHLGAGLVLLQQLQQPAPAYQHFLDALEHAPSSEITARARAALRAIAAQQKLQVGRARVPTWE
jgi:membrane associated rhomboid family serine protease